MQEDGFKKFLENDKNIKGKNGVSFRMGKARKVEQILEKDLDFVVDDDDIMYTSLIKIREVDDTKHAPLQNAMRKYYLFRNNKEFPQLRYYKNKH